MKKVSVLIIIYLLSKSSFAFENITYENINRLSVIERNIFGRPNHEYNFYERLNLAERKVFGAVQTGNYSERINLLAKVIEDSDDKITNIDRKPIKRFLRRGVITGVTPSLYQVYSFEN